jgi:molybdate transport repressor ModE-like protein
MPLDPRRLLLLRTVRHTGSVLAAARALHLTPSGVSQHITKLETEAGLALVDRDHRGGGRTIRFTPAGNALADYADSIAQALTAAERGIARLRDSPATPLRIGGFSVALSELAVPVTMRMATVDPTIEPRIYEVSASEGERMLAAGDLDLLLTELGAEDHSERPLNLVEIPVMRDPLEIIVPRTWPADLDLEALLARPWITTSFRLSTRRHLERLCREHSIELDAHDIGAGSAPTLLALVANGVGATIIPTLALRQNPSPNVRISKAITDPSARELVGVHREDAPATVTKLVTELRRYATEELQTGYRPAHT